MFAFKTSRRNTSRHTRSRRCRSYISGIHLHRKSTSRNRGRACSMRGMFRRMLRQGGTYLCRRPLYLPQEVIFRQKIVNPIHETPLPHVWIITQDKAEMWEFGVAYVWFQFDEKILPKNAQTTQTLTLTLTLTSTPPIPIWALSGKQSGVLFILFLIGRPHCKS